VSNTGGGYGCLLWIIIIILFAIASKMGAC
jgi:hypothetical protein